jgi:ariadne-1
MPYSITHSNFFPSCTNNTTAPAGLKSGIRMMRAEDLRPVMVRRVTDVEEVLGVPPSAAAVLLREYGFSKENLLEDFYNSPAGKPEKLLQKAGVFHRCGHVISAPKSGECAICYSDDLPDAQMLAMPCGHAFCKDCWFDFCVNAIDEGPSCVRTTCPDAQCVEVVTEDEMTVALSGRDRGAEQLAKFQTYQLRTFVESNALTRWCPGRGCERVACAESASAMEAEGNIAHCDACSLSFCLLCGEEPVSETADMVIVISLSERLENTYILTFPFSYFVARAKQLQRFGPMERKVPQRV